MSTTLSEHAFGGMWTRHKLEILRSYLSFYTTALKAAPFKLVYIDAFAGTGRCTIRYRGSKATIAGSAQIALDNTPRFHELVFIEKKPKHVLELELLLARHPAGPAARIIQGTADDELMHVLAGQAWKSTRGVLFLDPYGLQCSWKTVEQIAATRALDVFFLVSLSGLYRQATNDLRDADESKVNALTRFLGTDEWKMELYQAQGGLFGGDTHHRHADAEGLARYMRKRLETAFAKVVEPTVLYRTDDRGRRGPPLFALFFAVSNPSSKAIALASRVSKEIMSKLGQP